MQMSGGHLLAAGLDGGNTIIFPKEKCDQVPPRHGQVTVSRKEHCLQEAALERHQKGEPHEQE